MLIVLIGRVLALDVSGEAGPKGLPTLRLTLRSVLVWSAWRVLAVDDSVQNVWLNLQARLACRAAIIRLIGRVLIVDDPARNVRLYLF